MCLSAVLWVWPLSSAFWAGDASDRSLGSVFKRGFEREGRTPTDLKSGCWPLFVSNNHGCGASHSRGWWQCFLQYNDAWLFVSTQIQVAVVSIVRFRLCICSHHTSNQNEYISGDTDSITAVFLLFKPLSWFDKCCCAFLLTFMSSVAHLSGSPR